MTDAVRPAAYRYSQAVDVGLAALDAGDTEVHAAAARVQVACRLAKLVARTDIDLMTAFAQ